MNLRTLEILGTLGLEAQLRKEGMPHIEMSQWDRSPENPGQLHKLFKVPFFLSPARYEQLITTHQGRIESMFREDIVKYGGNDVIYKTTLLDVKIDEENAEFPVLAILQNEDGSKRTIRTKFLVGADGAKSIVRDILGVETEGERTDELWGVIDFIVDSDFPDIRRHTNINANVDSENNLQVTSGGLLIPRERQSNGEYLTRIYMDLTTKEPQSKGDEVNHAEQQREKVNEIRQQVTKEIIIQRVKKLFHPYRIDVKAGTEVLWYAAYRVSQRVAKRFTQNDKSNVPRVFIVGDACHTHSPRQGQGMNVSMHDSHNLAWKITYNILGYSGPDLLRNYEEERLPNARELIAFDKRVNQGNMVIEDRMSEFRQFTGSAGVEYSVSVSVDREGLTKDQPYEPEDYIKGIIYPGRRFMNIQVTRFADGVPRDLHDEVGGDGRLAIVVVQNQDAGGLDAESASVTNAVAAICVDSRYPKGLLRPLFLYPDSIASREWMDLPQALRIQAEMNVYGASQEVYNFYGVGKDGALVVVRPDGFVGTMVGFNDVEGVQKYVDKVLSAL